MALTVLTPASTRRLTSLERLYDDFGVSTVEEHRAAYEHLIDSVSAAIERFCGRIFAQQRYRETLAPMYGPHLILRHAPLVSVASVAAGGTPLTGWRIDDAEAGLLWHAYGWTSWNGMAIWSTDGDVFEWTVEYIAGFILPEQTASPAPSGESLPADLEQAAVEGVKVWREERLPSQRIMMRRFEDQAISYSIQAGKYALPKLSQDILLAGGWKRTVLR